jgi:hypothetical protein
MMDDVDIKLGRRIRSYGIFYEKCKEMFGIFTDLSFKISYHVQPLMSKV